MSALDHSTVICIMHADNAKVHGVQLVGALNNNVRSFCGTRLGTMATRAVYMPPPYRPACRASAGTRTSIDPTRRRNNSTVRPLFAIGVARRTDTISPSSYFRLDFSDTVLDSGGIFMNGNGNERKNENH